MVVAGEIRQPEISRSFRIVSGWMKMERGTDLSSSEADATSDRYSMQFNSTAFVSVEETSGSCGPNVSKKPDLKLSPILHDSDRRTVYSRRMVQYKCRGESPLVRNARMDPPHPLSDISEIRAEKSDESTSLSHSVDEMEENSVSDKENNRPGTSTPERNMSIPTHSRSTNSFESRILETLHTNTFSPSVFAITETPPSPEEFKWSIEELSILKPVHITQEEIAQSSYSPDPETEAKIQSILDEYWRNNTCHILSPDVAVKNPLTMGAPETPLCDAVRVQAAFRLKYSTSSPKARPNVTPVSRRTSFIQPQRSKFSQTDITIDPSADVDFSKLLGASCIYNAADDCDDESVFDATASSVGSLRRRLFLGDDDASQAGDVDDDLNASTEHFLDNTQNMVRFDLDEPGKDFGGFADIELSPIKQSPSL
ncbi:hypothetical protein Y032_0043g772 [Ancylostoma ceylanicum]|uniref:Protein aurora borealis n=1 Tax=Ancylostoma ceylanicum TaxID=53326 RepID=A0A016UEJ9_9BILA|nr:hypothetical protein Y032_0043g772 [Ancylostoma ceylanicum]